MTLFYERDGITLYVGDNREVLPTLEPESISAVVTDPPYGLSFMGRDWDHAVPGIPFWNAIAYTMLPGAHLCSFGGTRTFHRIAVAIEDAGFEVRDTLMWLYGSGFPKSLDVGKAIDKAAGAEREVTGPGRRHASRAFGSGEGDADYGTYAGGVPPETAPATDAAQQWDGWGTALKPAYEPVILARKPLSGTVAAQVLATGTGALNIDASRVASEGGKHREGEASQERRYTDKGGTNFAPLPGPRGGDPAGRWPSNVLLGCCGHDPHDASCAAAVLDAQSGERPSGKGGHQREMTSRGYEGGALGQRRADDHPMTSITKPGYDDTHNGPSRYFPRLPVDDPEWYVCDDCHITRHISDLTSGCPQCGETMVPAASPLPVDDPDTTRFLYTAKASRAERNRGLEGMPERDTASITGRQPGSTGLIGNPDNRGQTGNPYASATGAARQNHHPTVKPLALMRWLLTLVTPPGGVVLDPFAGSGSTLVAAAQLGIQAVGIEMSEEYCEIAARRIDHALDERARGAVFGNGTDARRSLAATGERPSGSGNGSLAHRRTREGGDFAGNGGNVTTDKGRWPCNVILDQAAARELDQQSGESVSRIGKPRKSAQPGNGYGMTHTGAEYSDAGGASRYMVVLEGDDEPVLRQRSLFDKAGD